MQVVFFSNNHGDTITLTTFNDTVTLFDGISANQTNGIDTVVFIFVEQWTSGEISVIIILPRLSRDRKITP